MASTEARRQQDGTVRDLPEAEAHDQLAARAWLRKEFARSPTQRLADR